MPPARDASVAIVVDPTGKIVGVAASWKAFLAASGLDPALAEVGMNYADVLQHWDPQAPEALQEVWQGDRQRVLEVTGAKGGIEVEAQALPPPQGGALLTHRRRQPKLPAYDRSRTLFRDILSETHDAVFLCSPSGRLLLANRTTLDWLGLPEEEALGKKIATTFSPECARLLLEGNAEVIAAAQTQVLEIPVPMARRGMRTFLVTKGLHRSATGKIKGVFGIARDISGVRAMEREIIDTSDKEKQRIGQELHENLCQYLVGISLLGNVLYEELLRMKVKQAEDARQITTLVKEAITEVRALVKGLSTMPLEQEEGLNDALRDLAEQARIISKIPCSLRVPFRANFVDPSVAVHLFRIAQEAVHNAIKHARATRLQISLTNNRQAIILCVKDDGIGFSGTRPLVTDASSGLGLHIMHYRSRAIGARLEIERLGEKGTAVICTLPKRGG